MSNKTKNISTINQNGGVDKTATIADISAMFFEFCKKVFVIDFDSQINANYTVGVKFVLRNSLTTLRCND